MLLNILAMSILERLAFSHQLIGNDATADYSNNVLIKKLYSISKSYRFFEQIFLI